MPAPHTADVIVIADSGNWDIGVSKTGYIREAGKCLVMLATIAAKPWVTAKPDPRLAALTQREQRLHYDAKLVQQVVERIARGGGK